MKIIYVLKATSEFFFSAHLRSLYLYLLNNQSEQEILKKVIISNEINLEDTKQGTLWKYVFQNNFPNIDLEFHKDYLNSFSYEQNPDLYYFVVNDEYIISCSTTIFYDMINLYKGDNYKYLISLKYYTIFLNSSYIYSLNSGELSELKIVDFMDNVFSQVCIKSKKIIGIHVHHFSIRGSEIALYDYACYINTYLDHIVYIIVPENHKEHRHPTTGLTYDKSIHDKFLNSFNVCEYTDLNETLTQIKADIFYTLKSGEKDHIISNNATNIIHCVFQCNEENKHGDIYGCISENINKCNAPVVPHICHSLPQIKEKLHESDSKYVFGCYGGYESFDIEFVHKAIKHIVDTRNDISFIFMNINKFIDHPLVKFYDKMTSLEDKSKFINSCDAMIHARSVGESFGMAISEFTTLQTPIITWKHEGEPNPHEDLHHISVLQETGIYYKNEEDLINIFTNFNDYRRVPNDYSKIFTPEKVMAKFDHHFLQSFQKYHKVNIKKEDKPTRVYKIKILCNWTCTEKIHKDWEKLIGDYPIEYTNDDPDYWVIINKPPENSYYDKNKTIVFGMEPDTFFADRWQWYNDKKDYFYFMDESYRTNTEWWLNSDLKELEQTSPTKTKDIVVSSIVSSQYIYEGHRLRIDFLKEAEKELDFDIYGWDNNHNFSNYCGRLDDGKNQGLFPYKYTFIAENVSKDNFFTEKFVDAILSECLIFYWGCTNIDSFFNPLCYVSLDLYNITNSIRKIRQTIMSNQWEKRLSVIKEMKQLILRKYSFIPRILGLIKVSELEKRTINLNYRTEKWENHRNICISSQVHNIKRFEAIKGDAVNYNELNIPFILTHNFISKNTGGVIGCALSHYNLWKETVSLNKPMLIMEDDITFCEQFVDRLGNVLDDLRDVLFLGFHDHESNLRSNNLPENFLLTEYKKYEVISFDQIKKYGQKDGVGLSGGGTFGYLLSPEGAQKLIESVHKYSFYFPVDYWILECGLYFGLNIDFTPHRLIYSPKFGLDTESSDIQR